MKRPKVEQIPSPEVIRRIAAESQRVVLSFSRGKDSLAAWLALRPHFEEIIPIFHYDFPGLSFVEEHLAQCEKFFGTRIRQVPHPGLFNLLRCASWQEPVTVPYLEACGYQNATFHEIKAGVFPDENLDDPWIGMGTRASDSTTRAMSFGWWGAIRKNRTFYPIWDLKKAEVYRMLSAAGLPLPIDYEVWGRSFDGFDVGFLAGLRKHFPDDYRKVVDAFPLLECEFYRKELWQKSQPSR